MASSSPTATRARARPGFMLLALTLLAIAISGCATERAAERATAAQTALVGLTEADLLACAGPPQRSARNSDGSVWWLYQRGTGDRSYSAGSQSRPADVGIGGDTFAPLRGGGTGGGGGAAAYCEVTVTLADGAVAAIDYRANRSWRDTGLAACDSLIGRCMAFVDTGPAS